MLNKPRMPALEISQRLCLHPVAMQRIVVASEHVPRLSDDMAANQIPRVHAHGFEFTSPPNANLVHKVADMEPEHGRRLEGRRYVDTGDVVGRDNIGRDRDLARRFGGSSNRQTSATDGLLKPSAVAATKVRNPARECLFGVSTTKCRRRNLRYAWNRPPSSLPLGFILDTWPRSPGSPVLVAQIRASTFISSRPRS